MLWYIWVSTSLKSDLQMADSGFLLLKTLVRETQWLVIHMPRDWFQQQQNSSSFYYMEDTLSWFLYPAAAAVPALSGVSLGNGCENAHYYNQKQDFFLFFLNRIKKV